MAASSSRRNAQAFRTRGGAHSERDAAAPTPSGTALSIAISEGPSVPYTNTSAPKEPRSGFQSVLLNSRYFDGSDRTGQDWTTRATTRTAATARTNPPADWHSARKIRSPRDGGEGLLAASEVMLVPTIARGRDGFHKSSAGGYVNPIRR